jgi:CBS domain-containing protein
MIPDPVTAVPDETLSEFFDGMAGVARYTAYPVVRDGEALGVLPLRRVLETPRSEWEQRHVRECMVPRDGSRSSARTKKPLRRSRSWRRRPSIAGWFSTTGHLAGFISISDIARLLAETPRRGSNMKAQQRVVT